MEPASVVRIEEEWNLTTRKEQLNLIEGGGLNYSKECMFDGLQGRQTGRQTGYDSGNFPVHISSSRWIQLSTIILLRGKWTLRTNRNQYVWMKWSTGTSSSADPTKVTDWLTDRHSGMNFTKEESSFHLTVCLMTCRMEIRGWERGAFYKYSWMSRSLLRVYVLWSKLLDNGPI